MYDAEYRTHPFAHNKKTLLQLARGSNFDLDYLFVGQLHGISPHLEQLPQALLHEHSFLTVLNQKCNDTMKTSNASEPSGDPKIMPVGRKCVRHTPTNAAMVVNVRRTATMYRTILHATQLPQDPQEQQDIEWEGGN
jgi:hypothetical protein